MKISGYTMTRNALQLDYAIQPCVESLLAGCDEVVVGDAQSTDGTREMLEEWALKEKRLRVVGQAWPDPVGHVQWFVEWINNTRQNLKHEMQLQLDADEVFDTSGYKLLRSVGPEVCLTMHRLNYWGSPHTLIPHGRCCSHLVTRFGPSRLYMSSDEIYGGHDFPGPEPEIRQRATFDSRLVIHHLGFLRKREAIFAKSKVVLKAFFNGYDTRLEAAEKDPARVWWQGREWFESLPLIPYSGPWPEGVRKWCVERGYKI